MTFQLLLKLNFYSSETMRTVKCDGYERGNIDVMTILRRFEVIDFSNNIESSSRIYIFIFTFLLLEVPKPF